jgi:hypothetical protein
MVDGAVRLGTWNCQMGWAMHGPDDGLWFGHNPRKGLGVGSPSGAYTFEAAGLSSFRWLVPLRAASPTPCNLLATWSFNHRQPGVRRALADALTDHADVFAAGPTVVDTG